MAEFFIDFESDATAFYMANGFVSQSSPLVKFSSSGTDLSIFKASEANSARSLVVFSDTGNALIIEPTSNSDFSLLSLVFGNDDAEGLNRLYGYTGPIYAVLAVYEDGAKVGETVVQANGNDLVDQTITAPNVSFDKAVFYYAWDLGSGLQPASLIEVVDNVAGTVSNQPPTANPDTVSTQQNTALTIQAVTLLANDTDPNGDTLTVTGVSNPQNGTVALNNNGTPGNSADDFVSFTPSTGFSGNASFSYSISDGNGGTDTASVAVSVGTVQGGANGGKLYTGNNGNDSLIGGNGSDTLLGNGGNDTLSGGNGNDTLVGGRGRDTVTGGNGNDVFVLAAGDGSDTFTDFKAGTDVIGLTGGLNFGQLTISPNGSTTLIKFGSETLATLTGVSSSQLTAANFVTV